MQWKSSFYLACIRAFNKKMAPQHFDCLCMNFMNLSLTCSWSRSCVNLNSRSLMSESRSGASSTSSPVSNWIAWKQNNGACHPGDQYWNYHPGALSLRSGGHFKNTCELLNPRALKISMLNKNFIFQCMGKIFCVEFQRYPLKFHTKYHTHTLRYVFVQHWNFKSS